MPRSSLMAPTSRLLRCWPRSTRSVGRASVVPIMMTRTADGQSPGRDAERIRNAVDVTRPSAPLGRLDLERQTVDLRGVVDVDEVLLGHQLDFRIAQDSHAVFFDGFPVV